MKGYHLVKEFLYTGNELPLPAGWKPFAAYQAPGGTVLVCRKWQSLEKKA